MRPYLLLAGLALAVTCFGQQGAPGAATGAKGPAAEPDAAFTALETAYVAASKQYLAATRAVYETERYKQLREAGDNAGIRALLAAYERPEAAFVERFLALADASKGDARARCLLWVASNSRDAKSKRAAIDSLLAGDLDGPHVQELVAGWTGTLLGLRQGRDEVLQRIIAGSHNPETLAEATWLQSYLGEGPKASEAVRAQVAARFPDSTVALRHHAERFQQEHLQVGMTAPDIAGVDTDGVPFKLGDYRGKVVLLDFWGDW